MKFVITGGGTGGHLVIAKALAQQVVQDGDEAIFIGSQNGQDRAWFEHDTIFKQTHFLKSRGVVNRSGFGKIFALIDIAKATIKARNIIQKYGADATISVGGFSSAPASFASLLLRKPLFIHEQNAVLGRLNKMLQPYARSLYSSYLPQSVVKNYPTKEIFFENARVREEFKTILFLGGSQGAQAINRFALEAAPMLSKRGFKIIHQCGEANLSDTQKSYSKLGIDIELYGFTEDVASLICRADVCVSRAGASTLWELVASALPTLFVPYPHAAANHQYHNALHLQKEALASICKEELLDTKALEDFLAQDLAKMSQQLMHTNSKGGAKDIMASVRELTCS